MPIGGSDAEFQTHATSSWRKLHQTPQFEEVHTEAGYSKSQEEGRTRSGGILQAILYIEEARTAIVCLHPPLATTVALEGVCGEVVREGEGSENHAQGLSP